jgi:hypothetical protein
MKYVSGFSPPFLPETTGASYAAFDVDRQSLEAVIMARLGAAGAGSRSLHELQTVANEHGLLSQYEGLHTFNRAVALLASLPSECPRPEISVDPDNEIAFDWAKGADLFSISIGPSGRLSFASDINGATGSGVAFFTGALPPEVRSAIDAFR